MSAVLKLSEITEGYVQTLPQATAHSWDTDPKHLGFNLARYKFVAKMLQGYEKVLEVGCSDGFASPIVAQSVGKLTAVDNDPSFIKVARTHASKSWNIDYRLHDITDEPLKGFDAAYSMDVIEHTTSPLRFMESLAQCAPVCVVGSPSLESQKYASSVSRSGHINCMTARELNILMRKFFEHVFSFGMNDEVLHTGYEPMRHYLLAIGVK